MSPRPAFVRFALLAAALGLIAPGGARAQPEAGDGDTILPGYWSYSTSALYMINKTERRCLRAHEIERVMNGAINRHLRCTTALQGQSFGPVSMKGVCTDKKGHRVSVSMKGAFSPTTLDMNVQVAGIIPYAVHAKRLSATCPAGEEAG